MAQLKFTLGFVCAITFLISNVSAQDLTGKELTKSDDVGSLVESGIGMLLGASKMEGDIKKATVTTDTHNSLSVKITFEGFSGAWLKGSIIAPDKSKIKDIVSSPVQFPESGTGDIEITFELKENPQNNDIQSSLLKLLVCKRENDASGKVYAFILEKEWKTDGLSAKKNSYDFIDENEVVDITPVPIGSASGIKDADIKLPVPAKTFRVAVNKNLYRNNVIRKPMVIKPVRIQQQPGSNKVNISKTSNFKPLYTEKKTQSNQQKKPVFNPNIKFTAKTLQLSKEQIDKGALGPGNMAISLWDEIMSDVNFDYSGNSITNINTDIFPDKNEKSGYYYYFPASYNLEWNRDDSYNLKILYGTASEGESGQVNMFVQLTPGVGTKEKAMVKELVKEYARANNLPFEKLLPVPLSGVPQVDLSNQLSSLYNIPSDKISTTVTGLFDPVDISWPMSSKNADDLMVALKEINLTGQFKLTPQGEMPEVNIPVTISFNDEKVLGRIELSKNTWRTKEWKNEMPFPVKLKYIHALILNKDDKGSTVPFIYSWDLGDKEVPVLAKVNINSSGIPKIVDSKAQRIWMEYSVPQCRPCMDKIINELTGGTTTAREQKIEIVSYVKERTGALALEVRIRSRFADTKGEKIIELPPVKILEDGESYFAGPLFVPEGEKLEYEYQIKLVTDEDVLVSEWIYSDATSIYLNKKVIADALGKFPGE